MCTHSDCSNAAAGNAPSPGPNKKLKYNAPWAMIDGMDNSLDPQVLDTLFAVLSRDGSGRMQERKALVQGCREAGLSAKALTEAWRAWKSRQDKGDSGTADTPGDSGRLKGTNIVAFLSCLVLEAPLSPGLVQASIACTSTAIQGVIDEAPTLSRMDWATRLDRISSLLRPRSAESAAPNPAGGAHGSAHQGPAHHAGHGHHSTKHPPKDEQSIYIANQISEEGFDELQRLCLASQLGIHVAIDGPPGVGKTQSVIEVCRILGRPLFTKNCSSRTTEAHIIASPVLKALDGVSVTDYQNGPLASAMCEGGVFYGDEFNLLKEDVQKRLNSAFDDRRSIDRPDGLLLEGQKGFWSVISYNPSDTMTNRDLEESVADRFMHLHYQRWDPDFKAFVAWSKARGTSRSQLVPGNAFGLPLTWRGIDPAGMRFARAETAAKTAENSKGLVWKDFFSGKPCPEPPYVYLVCDKTSILTGDVAKTDKALQILADQAYDDLELARLISRFTEILQDISTTGDAPMLKKIGLGNLREKEDLELLKLHQTSTRIEMAAARHYRWLCDRGCNRYLAQSHAVRLVMDQACYGQFRDRKLREVSSYELVKAIAKSMRLLASGVQYNTNFQPESLLGKSSKSE